MICRDMDTHPRPDIVPRPLVAVTLKLPNGAKLPPRSRARHQLIHAHVGVIRVTTADGVWVVPPGRGVFIAAGLEHELVVSGDVDAGVVYLEPNTSDAAHEGCRAVAVSPLLAELIARAVQVPTLYAERGRDARLMSVLRDEIEAAPSEPLGLRRPADRRLRAVTDGLEADPALGRPLEEWAARVGASTRTLARLFPKETGLTFGVWRQRLRLARSLEALARGASVTEVAPALGYESASAFIAMFRRTLGQTPSRYLDPARWTSGRAIPQTEKHRWRGDR